MMGRVEGEEKETLLITGSLVSVSYLWPSEPQIQEPVVVKGLLVEHNNN